MEHIFVINPAAGVSDSTHIIEEAIAKSNYSKYCEIYCTTGPGDATAYVASRCAQSSSPLRFYACGGDGTLNEVVNGVANFTHASVGCYPCGSGNDFVKYYGGADGFLNIDNQINGIEYPIDLIRSGDKYCINVLSFGFDTAVVQTMEKVKRYKLFGGKRAYFAGVAKALFASMKTSCKVSVDGEIICSNNLLLCTIANGTYVGSTFKCAPRSKNNDGLLEVCLVKPISRIKFFTLINHYIKGEHLDSPKFKNCMIYRRGSRISVEGNSSFAYTLDGEIVNVNSANIEVVENALNFVIPRDVYIENEKVLCSVSL